MTEYYINAILINKSWLCTMSCANDSTSGHSRTRGEGAEVLGERGGGVTMAIRLHDN